MFNDLGTHGKPGPLSARRSVLALAGLAGAALALTACGSSSSTAAPVAPVTTPSPVAATGAVLKTESSGMGTILVDSQGRAVYMFTADTPGHSACTGTCLTYWPIVPAPATLPTSIGAVSATLGVLDRPDGTKQVTVNGQPLYRYAADTNPGAVNGQGANLSGGFWWVLSPNGNLDKMTAASGAGTQPSPTVSPTPTPAQSKSASSGGGGWA